MFPCNFPCHPRWFALTCGGNCTSSWQAVICRLFGPGRRIISAKAQEGFSLGVVRWGGSLQAARAQLAITVTTEVEDVELAVELAEGEAQDEGGRGRVHRFPKMDLHMDILSIGQNRKFGSNTGDTQDLVSLRFPWYTSTWQGSVRMVLHLGWTGLAWPRGFPAPLPCGVATTRRFCGKDVLGRLCVAGVPPVPRLAHRRSWAHQISTYTWKVLGC